MTDILVYKKLSQPDRIGLLRSLHRSERRPFSDDEILAQWRRGRDTLDISKSMGVTEAAIASVLPRILALARQDQEWNWPVTGR